MKRNQNADIASRFSFGGDRSLKLRENKTVQLKSSSESSHLREVLIQNNKLNTVPKSFVRSLSVVV